MQSNCVKIGHLKSLLILDLSMAGKVGVASLSLSRLSTVLSSLASSADHMCMDSTSRQGISVLLQSCRQVFLELLLLLYTRMLQHQANGVC